MKKILLLLTFFVSIECLAQDSLSLRKAEIINEALLNVKFQLINTMFINDKSFYQEIMNLELEYRELESKGFKEDCYFIEIIIEPMYELANSNVLFKYTGYAVIAISYPYIYRLKGFEKNDFIPFIDSYISTKSEKNNFWIESIDIDCLFKYRYGNSKRKKKLKCLCPMLSTGTVMGTSIW